PPWPSTTFHIALQFPLDVYGHPWYLKRRPVFKGFNERESVCPYSYSHPHSLSPAHHNRSPSILLLLGARGLSPMASNILLGLPFPPFVDLCGHPCYPWSPMSLSYPLLQRVK